MQRASTILPVHAQGGLRGECMQRAPTPYHLPGQPQRGPVHAEVDYYSCVGMEL